MKYLFTCIRSVIFGKSFALTRKFLCVNEGFPAFIMIFLCFVFHPSIQAQNQVQPGEFTFENNLVHDTIFIRDSVIIDNTLAQSSNKQLYIAVKNNLLYDILLLPNLAAEVYLGKQWSLAINGNWSWWTLHKQAKTEWSHRIQTAGAEVRYWINSPAPLHGHALGIYTTIGNYDVRLFPKDEFSKGWLSNLSWTTGLSYAYSMPITSHLNLEFGVAGGYAGGQYHEYDFCPEHEWWAQRTTKNRHYFGLTHVGVSLVWLIGRVNIFPKKEIYFIRD